MFTLERVTEAYFDVVREIVHSNPSYHEWKNGMATDEELQSRFLQHAASWDSYFIKADDTYIGLLSYREHAERDGHIWIDLLMIHGAYQGYGYGTNAYFMIEGMCKEKGIKGLSISIPKQHIRARRFWEGLGFVHTGEHTVHGTIIDSFEKQLL